MRSIARALVLAGAAGLAVIVPLQAQSALPAQDVGLLGCWEATFPAAAPDDPVAPTEVVRRVRLQDQPVAPDPEEPTPRYAMTALSSEGTERSWWGTSRRALALHWARDDVLVQAVFPLDRAETMTPLRGVATLHAPRSGPRTRVAVLRRIPCPMG